MVMSGLLCYTACCLAAHDTQHMLQGVVLGVECPRHASQTAAAHQIGAMHNTRSFESY
jgi:hypothetical protein